MVPGGATNSSNLQQSNILPNSMVGPLLLNQGGQQQPGGKRHVSVDPHTGKNTTKNSGQATALIPNGLNNGRVYRRQSSDAH